jgi:hypothetical protein
MMRKSLILLVLLAISFTPLNLTFSAEERAAAGKMEVGGDIYASYHSYKATAITTFTLMPRVGLFVMPGLEVEPKILILFKNISPHGNREDSSKTDIGGMLSLAYHFELKRGSKFIPFVFGGIGFVNHAGDVGEDDEVTLVMPDVGLGLKAFLTNSALIRMELFYQHLSNAYGKKDREVNEGGLRGGVSIFLN